MLTVGQKLWCVPSYRRGTPHEVTVEKVGRKWANIGYRDRIDIETLRIDGGEYSSPGACYVSKQSYDDTIKLHQAWNDFRQLIDHSRIPKDITIERIWEAQRVLGL